MKQENLDNPWTHEGEIFPSLGDLTEPVMTQFFLGTNLEFLTGKSHTSNDLISC